MKNKKDLYTFIVSLILFIIGIFSIFYLLYFHKNDISIYNFSIQKSDDYLVLLKPNDFYQTETLPPGGYYPANAINSYIIEYRYELTGDKKTNIEYNYNVEAYLVGTVKNIDNQDKEVWNRKFILSENTNGKENTDKVYINKKINIDYEYFNNLVRSYENSFDISIESILKVRFNLNYNIDLNENINKKEDSIELEIPITSSVSEVRENYEKITNDKIIQQEEKNNFNKIVFYSIAGIMILVSLVNIIVIGKKYIKIEKQQYKHKLKHILNYYKDIIINISSELDLNNLKTIYVEDFHDLIDLAEQTQRNILYYNNYDKDKSKFFVIVDNYVYIFLLKNI